MRRPVHLLATIVLAVLLVGLLPAGALQLAKVEAEQDPTTVGTWGAVVNDTTASGGRALRWNRSATTGTLNFTISEPADSVSVYIKAGSNSASRVCVRPRVDNVALGTQPLCVARTQRTYIGRTFAANLDAGSHTLSLSGSDISGTDRLFADYTSFDTSEPPPPPSDTDGDGVADSADNCPAVANANQADADSDGVGDVCDDDRDGDTVLNDGDNCPDAANADQANADGDAQGDACDPEITPPNDPYPNPTSTSQTFGEGWTPAANSVHLNPRIRCSTDPTPPNTGTGQGGVNIVNQNVVLINPEITECSLGILVRAGGFKLLADKSKVGYASAASPAIGNNYRGVYFDRGSFGYELKGLNDGELFMRNNYIPINLQAGHSCLIADTHIDHPTTLDWDPTGSGRLSGPRRAKVGIKARADYTLLPVSDRSFHDCVISSNDVSGFEEEGISLDANGGGRDEVTLVQGTSPLAAVDAATDTVTLAQPSGGQWTNLQNAQGAWLSFNQGGAVGRYLQIVRVDAASRRLTLSDPNDYLSLAAAGDPVSVSAPYRNITISENVINAQGSRVGVDFHGPVYSSRLANNTVTGTQTYQYGSDNHLRVTPDGVAPQSIRITTLADMPPGTMTPRPHVGVASYNSVVGNNVMWDISFHTRDSTTYRGIPAYRIGNTSTNGVPDYNDPTYDFLLSDPNP